MKFRRTRLTLGLLVLSFAAACTADVGSTDKADSPTDVSTALSQFPDAVVLEHTTDGLPTYIVGEMTKVGGMQNDNPVAADQALRPALSPILKAFRLETGDLSLRKMNVDDEGNRHFRYSQKFGGLDVIGGELVVHVDVKGAIYSVNGPARGDISADLGKNPIAQAKAMSVIAADARFSHMSAGATRVVYIQTDDGAIHKAYETEVAGARDGGPARDKVYTDLDTGAIVADYPQINTAEARKVYSANNGTSLPGTLKISEGQSSTDADVQGAYSGTGDAYEAYKNFFGRDSYDNAGAQLISSVHYDNNYCNAYWDGVSQMVYGDGDASQNCLPLPRAVDVTAHELTHAVTQNESGLNYTGESGGMNEAMSDIFGSWVEAWVDGGKTGTLAVSTNTWLIGELVLPPALRYMCNPAQDGASADVYSSTVGNLDVHYSSGVGNLAFCLLSTGGQHPTGKTTNNVPGIGMEKAIRILYKAQTDILTSTAKFATVRTAMEQAATSLGYDQATLTAVGCAWAAVKVGTAPADCSGTGGGSGSGTGSGSGGGTGSGSGTGSGGGGSTDGTLVNGTPITGISGATGSSQFWQMNVPNGETSLTISISGGTGDADLYVLQGNKPTMTVYTCRPYKTGNSETCTITPPTAGTYWVMLNGYAAFTGVTLSGSYTGAGGGGGGGGGTGDPYLTNGVKVTGVAGAASSNQYWRVAAPAGKTLKVSISGGTGDADLYTRKGSRPTTSTYDCRPYVTGNTESCTATNTTASDYYVMVRGYSAFTGISLVASY